MAAMAATASAPAPAPAPAPCPAAAGTRNDEDDDDDEDDDNAAGAGGDKNGLPQRRGRSPPLPTRHTAATPGPRAQRLRDVYARSLRKTLDKLDWPSVAACYPTVAAGAEPVLRQVRAQMVEKLGEKCEKEFDEILASRQVVPKLNELEGLIGDASHRRATSSDPNPTPPHLLPPEAVVAAHAHPALAQHQSRLNARLQTAQSQNARLHELLLHQRHEIEALLRRLEDALADVAGANDVLAPLVDDLARESRDAVSAAAPAPAATRGAQAKTTQPS